MRRMLASLAVAIASIATAAIAGDGSEITASQAVEEIRTHGGRAFIDKHFDSEAWNQVLRGIESGNPQWLVVAEALKRHSDAGSSEELGLALFAALAVTPLRVLPVLQRIYKSSPEQLCNQTFEAELPVQGVTAYLQSIERGLRLARTSAERSMASACRRGLESSRKHAYENGLK